MRHGEYIKSVNNKEQTAMKCFQWFFDAIGKDVNEGIFLLSHRDVRVVESRNSIPSFLNEFIHEKMQDEQMQKLSRHKGVLPEIFSKGEIFSIL